jgi:tetratricopeptide (TPR) repeat protein
MKIMFPNKNRPLPAPPAGSMHQSGILVFINSICCILLLLICGCSTTMQSGDKAPEDSSSQQNNLLAAEQMMDAGRHHDRVGEYEKAIIFFDQALGTYSQKNDRKGQFEALLQLAQTYHSIGQFEPALEKSRAAESIAGELEDKRQVARALNVIFSIYLGAGHYDEAKQVLIDALA